MPDEPIRVLVVGAHPDDPDIKAGGMATKYAERGHDVRFLSMTDGAAGHHQQGGEALADRRRQEANAAAAAIGIDYVIFDRPDGELQATIENRRALIRHVREYDPDLLLTHRPNDYHPDHRYTATLVRDSTYMVRVPNVCPETPAIDREPVVGYLSDDFEKPSPFEPDVVVAIDDAIEQKLSMLHEHESQMYEWLPHVEGIQETVPSDPAARREWLRDWRLPDDRTTAEQYRARLISRYGDDRGSNIEYAEAIEISEYGAALTEEREDRLFPL